MTYDNEGRPNEPPQLCSYSDANTVARNDNRSIGNLIEMFPEGKLRSLTMKISSPRWVVPVLPDQELECLLNYAIELTKVGADEDCEPCVRFYREGLTVSFMKILTDEAVNSWKYNIHYCILNTCGKFMQLCALHINRDNPYLLELLVVVLDPENKFNTFNMSRQSEQYTIISSAPAVTDAIATTSNSTVTTTTIAAIATNTTSTTTASTPTSSSSSSSSLSPGSSATTDLSTVANFKQNTNAQQQPQSTNKDSTNSQQTPNTNESSEKDAATPNVKKTATATSPWGVLNESDLFAKSPADPHNPRGWLVDLINKFGQFGGFDNLFARFTAEVELFRERQKQQSSSGNANEYKSQENTGTSNDQLNSTNRNSLFPCDENNTTLHVIYALVRPFGQCYELLTVSTIQKYFMPMWDFVLELLNNLSDQELKRETKPDSRSDLINGIIKAARCLTSRVSNQDNLIKELEMFRLKMILRLLKISSFNGKMSALNEINKMLFSVSYYPHRTAHILCTTDEEMDWLSADKIAKWIKESNVLGIVLQDSLHQPQYVEKLEKILRFLIKEKSLTLTDLDALWRAQIGKHEAIVKNVHDLLAKLAWDFNTEQLDYLFGCFQTSMKAANKRQRERLLELIRRLAEDDKSGVMAHKVLQLFWALAHSTEISKEIMEQALAAHVKILDYSCAQERDAQKSIWLTKCVEELKRDDGWVLPALRLIREICSLYEPSTNHVQRMHQNLNRQHIIERLQNEHTLVILVTNSLISYMDRVRELLKEKPDIEPETLFLDERYPHQQQIQERLDFLKFVLKDGQLWLCSDQAKQIWQCLTVNAAFPADREECFRWFGKLMGDEPDLDPGINKDFFENNILQLDPQLLSESGIRCFERFFKAVNCKEEKLKSKPRGYILDDEDLIGKDYLWRVITTSNENISQKAIDLLKEVSTALGPRLQANIAAFHENFIIECCNRLRAYHDNIMILNETIANANSDNNDECKDIKLRHAEAEKMFRVIIVLLEYIKECDRQFTGDRAYLPLCRAFRGKHINLYIRFPGRQHIDDIEFDTHTNETVATFKRNILKRIKGTSLNNINIDFYYNNENLIEINDDRNPIGLYNIRDKMILTAKLTPVGPGLSSSPDSSSDSSTGSPPRPCPDVTKPESEWQLPGVIISQKQKYTEFFLRLYQLSIDLNHTFLRDSCRSLLQLLPIDVSTSGKLQQMCNFPKNNFDEEVQPITPDSMFLHAPPAHILYNLEVLYALLIPAVELNQPLLLSWIHSGVAHYIVDLLTKNNFLPNADVHTKRTSFHNVLRLVKVFLYVVGCVLSKVGDEPTTNSLDSTRPQVELLKTTFTSILGSTEQTIRTIAMKLADNLAAEMLSCEPEGEACRELFASALKWTCPNIQTIKAIVLLAWSSGSGCLNSLGSCQDFSLKTPSPEPQDHSLCKEALEVLTISLVLNPEASEALNRDTIWSKFIISLVLINPLRQIRQTAAEQLYLICTYCASDWRPFVFIMSLLINALDTLAPENSSTCAEYFQLLCRTLNYGAMYNWPLTISKALLTQEISFLQRILQNVKETGEPKVHEDILEGHLCLTKELLFYFNSDLKSQLNDFLMEILDEFLFPASRQYLKLQHTGELPNFTAPPPVCRSPHTITAACDLLIASCQNSVTNMKIIANNLLDMICSTTEAITEWEYLPPINARPTNGFCGLKNAGATCYMNSVLQQLYMVPSIRLGILAASGACNDPNEDFSNECESTSDLCIGDGSSNSNIRNRYHIGILKHVQAIFGHLAHSALQFYVPRGLWSHFKLQGEPVNLREQQDAVEFFMSILDSLDEGLKALGHPQLMSGTLGGCFSDQKICQQCPHRYSKDEPFSVLSVDIRNHSSLSESLEQYVKGELLEGADAYHCDKCDKKVVTIKRLCVRKLPPILAIQLKRFEYDYERVCAIKFNDYFEFPRFLDMEPYTVSGLAKIEGEVIEIDGDPNEDKPSTTQYQLTGIVVHSGQASGGHYFSYILHKESATSKGQWYKFDDSEVTECKMYDDEEMKAQCFGGDYMGEVFDANLKRMQFRRQKRWWNAYMLFYTRCDQIFNQPKPEIEQLSLAESRHYIMPLPAPIEKCVRIQNIRFLHFRSIFTVEFFNFIRKLVASTSARSEKLTPQTEELSLLGIQLGSQFLFHTGFHTKKNIRGGAIEWYEALCQHVRYSGQVRRWFAENALLSPPTRLSEYILVATSPEIRNIFIKLIVFFCHFALNDDPIQDPNYPGDSLCEQILSAVLNLLKTDVLENGKHLAQYFTLFSMYAGLGNQQKLELIKLNVPALFMQVAVEDSLGQSLKQQQTEFSKLHHVVSMLVRCCNIYSRCQNSVDGTNILPNIYGDQNIPIENMPYLSKEAIEYLFVKTSYIKKLIEDIQVGEEGLKMLQYCCWENPNFSRLVLVELLWQCGFAYWHDMRHHTDILLNILLIEDSWQNHRIHNALLGVAEEREGLLDTIQRTRMHYQKRAYQIIKFLVQLFKRSACAHDMLQTNYKIARQWVVACQWLREELDRRVSINQYYSWSQNSPSLSTITSNDNTNGYILERSQSAKHTLQMACELCPNEMEENGGIDSSDIDADDLPESALTRIQSQEQLNETLDTSIVHTLIIPNKKASSLVSSTNTMKSELEDSSTTMKDENADTEMNQTKTERCVNDDFTKFSENRCGSDSKPDDDKAIDNDDIDRDNYDPDSLKLSSLTIITNRVTKLDDENIQETESISTILENQLTHTKTDESIKKSLKLDESTVETTDTEKQQKDLKSP